MLLRVIPFGGAARLQAEHVAPKGWFVRRIDAGRLEAGCRSRSGKQQGQGNRRECSQGFLPNEH
jgi:hypothetical protein